MNITTVKVTTLILGSGLAGFNAADSLFDLGHKDIAIVTEDVNQGTSRNTGSDKQTYYKMALCSDQKDSVYDFATTLYAGGAMDGETALIEGAYSLRSFMKLVQLGVDFPRNKYGEYVGYKTDHDPRQRATSVGPYTSKVMIQALEKSVRNKDIRIFDQMMGVTLLVEDGRVEGLLALALNPLVADSVELIAFQVKNLILATGGPAGIYYYSAYPKGHTGMSGLALKAGAQGANLQEWQYGLASVKFPWNLSGTYQQVLPRYYSQDEEGKQREFLSSAFPNKKDLLSQVFLKGYQWPFDVSKFSGSSQIDYQVYVETLQKNRQVYLDFNHNSRGFTGDIQDLDPVSRDYLFRSGATQTTPLARLSHMNPEAIDLYLSQGIDLAQEPLEIAVCAQHNNGGLKVDTNWQTNISGLYAAGEVAGTFGVYRPGGSALNSTQTGSLRVAEAIASSIPMPDLPDWHFEALVKEASKEIMNFITNIMSSDRPSNVVERRQYFQREMSCHGGLIRHVPSMINLQKQIKEELSGLSHGLSIRRAIEIPHALKNQDMLITQDAVLSAMIQSAQEFGSRGSALVMVEEASDKTFSLGDSHFLSNLPDDQGQMMITKLEQVNYISRSQSVKPVPCTQDWFETVWQKRATNHNNIN